MIKKFVIYLHLFIVCFILYNKNLYAQQIIFSEPLIGVVTENINEFGSPTINAGDSIGVLGLMKIAEYEKFSVKMSVFYNNSYNMIGQKNIKKLSFIEENVRNFWDKKLLTSTPFSEIFERGYQYDIRNSLNSEAVQYINILSGNGRLYKDDYFEDYLYTLANKIHEGTLADKRPGNIHIKILKDTEPNAISLPNGSILITTGLLTAIQSEDELVGILTHEIAHFVLDHHIQNYNQTLDRKNNAEFWTAFATAVAVTADVYLTKNNKNHIPGILTGAAILGASIVSQEINKRLGINYSQKQELEADGVAKEMLGFLKYDKHALSVALNRIRKYCILTGNYIALSSEGSHPSIDVRINSLGTPKNFDYFIQKSYLKKVSFINTYNSWVELDYLMRHAAANDLVDKNINNGVGTELDYLAKAIIKRRLSNTKESNEDVLVLLKKAKELNINTPIRLYKEEALSFLRVDKKSDSKKSLQTYLNSLIEIKNNNEVGEIKNQNKDLEEEIDWTKKMIFKVDNL